jgi:hypothetical protein
MHRDLALSLFDALVDAGFQPTIAARAARKGVPAAYVVDAPYPGIQSTFVPRLAGREAARLLRVLSAHPGVQVRFGAAKLEFRPVEAEPLDPAEVS